MRKPTRSPACCSSEPKSSADAVAPARYLGDVRFPRSLTLKEGKPEWSPIVTATTFTWLYKTSWGLAPPTR